jgi:hypothetical protein
MRRRKAARGNRPRSGAARARAREASAASLGWPGGRACAILRPGFSVKGGPPIRERRLELVILAAFTALLVLHAASFRYTVDDAFISFRYARNWVEGNGLVFNAGERVEGYTNFLWTALVAGAMLLRLEPVAFARVAGIVAGILLLWGVSSLARRHLAERSILLLLPLGLAANGAFALWCGAGLETSLFAFLLFAGVAAAVREEGSDTFLLPSLFLALATLTRPEGALVYAALVIDRALFRRLPPRRILPGFALFLLAVGGHEAWRIAYYGDPLPNTYYAKTGGGWRAVERGFLYLGGYFGRFGGWTALLPLPLLFFGGIRRWERTVLLVVVSYLAYVVWAGGDSLPFYRFVAPAVPLLVLLAAAALDRLAAARGRSRRVLRTAGVALLFALPLGSSFGGEALRFLGEDRDRVELHWKVIGRWLAEHADPSSSIAVTTAGAIPYYSNLRTIDMLGINDPAIARRSMPGMGSGLAGHEKHDMAYVLARRPTYILHYPFLLPEAVFSTSQFRTPWNPGLEELLHDTAFDREYRGETAEIAPPGASRPLYLVYFRLREGGER